jgi:indoleamine 2,3-dioxygenase
MSPSLPEIQSYLYFSYYFSTDEMLDFPNISLDEYSISFQNGFLPTEPPLQRLPDPYYSPWEHIMVDLPALICSGEIRQEIRSLPTLSTERLHEEAEWRRAYLILSFLTHGYIWGGEVPQDVRRPQFTRVFPHSHTKSSPDD